LEEELADTVVLVAEVHEFLVHGAAIWWVEHAADYHVADFAGAVGADYVY
jgi:hypothetical protein